MKVYQHHTYSEMLSLLIISVLCIPGRSFSLSCYQLQPPRRQTSTARFSVSRRNALMTTTKTVASAAAALAILPLPARCLSDNNVNPFEFIKYELNDPAGGVARMQSLIDKSDYVALMEFTKQYDQVLRKQGIGRAKKLLLKEYSEKATLLSNAVTFDLIGINRSSRKGQENQTQAFKYLDELRQDVNSFLELESQVKPLDE